MKLAIILPAYNESKVLADVLKTLPKKITKIDQIQTIVVDDGSADNTFEIAKKYADYALRHQINLGVGGATLTGMTFARKIKADIAIVMDSDGQHDSSDIEKMIQPIVDGKVDITIGSRLINPKGMPKIKIITNKIANFITYLFTGVWVTDSQTGFRAYSKNALNKIKINTTGYEFCTEIFKELRKNNLKFIEIPIKVIYSDYSRKKGQSIANSVNIIIKLLLGSITK